MTSLGNVSHYFTYEYPGVELERERTVNSLLAFGFMGQFEGTIVRSNLDDGYGNQFHDLANLAGWTMLERCLVEDLLGASMTFGNTIDYGLKLSRNYGALSSFSLADAICQVHKPTGHAVASVPVTEASRIPTADEIIEGHLCMDMMLEKARLFEPYMNWSAMEAERDVLVACGQVFFWTGRTGSGRQAGLLQCRWRFADGVVGLSRTLSTQAARSAAFGAGGKLLTAFAGRLTPGDVRAMEALPVEILLLCGGYEGGGTAAVLHNAEMLAASALRCPVIYGGNSAAGEKVRLLLAREGRECWITGNLIPAVGQMQTGPAEGIIREVFLRRIINCPSSKNHERGMAGLLYPAMPLVFLPDFCFPISLPARWHTEVFLPHPRRRP